MMHPFVYFINFVCTLVNEEINMSHTTSKSLLESTQRVKSIDIMMEVISMFTCMFELAQEALSIKMLEDAPKHSIVNLIL
jgi:hypothetical protein